ncbi:hypothetical protein [Parasutterella sp.]|jgi:hypothetical protein|uniref:hypothetical protein n=1 Tax=Parasutterella sp. TaxID=2049037 RepID=UPI0035214997
MGLLSSLNSWLARKNLELLNDRAKKRAQNRVINWDEYPQGIVMSCTVLSNGVVSGTLKDQNGEERPFSSSKYDITEAIPPGTKVAYQVRPRDVRPRIKVLKVL